MGSVSGAERIYLGFRYESLGYSALDLKAVHSIFWWKRLRAISNLNILDLDRFAPVFLKLTKDRHQLVAAFAYIPLSGLNHHLNQVRPLDQLPRAVRNRKNVMHEILRNWVKVYGHEFLIEQIRDNKRPELFAHLVRAVSGIQSYEVSELLVAKLSDPNLPVDAAEQILILLKNAGDPAAAEPVKPLLRSIHEPLRLRAAEYFIALGDLDTLIAEGLQSDSSVAIRRALQKGAA